MLKTSRLTLRAFQPDDWRDLREYVTQADVMRYDRPWPSDEDGLRAAASYLATHDGYWAVCLRDTPQVIGHVTCTPSAPPEFLNWDLGFGFNPRFQRMGYATEACERVLQHVFEERGARRVTASCHPDNAPAWRLLERLGLRREAHHRLSGFLQRAADGEPLWSDAYEYAILATEWQASR